ncbi:uncharacterized protein [Anabrus simplex]|uniref:uncharacterized protein n=1 Tax=Anabrus simplex TaxID=316456 RepID=UPI0035A2CB5F
MKEEQERTPLRAILQNFLNHIEKLDSEEVEGSYDKEFQELKLFSEILKSSKQFSCSQGEKEVNRKKNRYKDILPFDESRVILDGYAGVPGSDYINANYIKGASGSPAYIASQAPLPHTVNDFWRMVVQCEVQVIVMACNEEEAGKHKCENYWVEREGEERQFGMVAIRLIKASVVCPDFLVRTMRLKYTNSQSSLEERTVCQFHYSAWPDHGVPPLVRPLLDMVRLVRDTQASETLPVLVHCSAGCGRTGTICAIDYVWGLLRAGKLTKDFSLFKLVRDMRRQRIAMVQTKEQYILVHHAVKELFCEQLRMIDSHPYENIDVNGMPLVKEGPEPMYATVAPENGSEEKQDSKEKEDSLNEKADISPSPNKKKHHIASSKHEKEVENLTEKQRSIVEQSSNSDSVGSLLQKPRIAKLKALFERAPSNRETRNLHPKHRSSQQVTRSHSLGAVRKVEIVNQPIPCKGILRVPQPATVHGPPVQSVRPAVPIKRSKSLKVLGSGECYKLSVASCDESSSSLNPSDTSGDIGNPRRLDSVHNSADVLVKDKLPSDSKPSIPPKKLIKDKVKDRKVISDTADGRDQSVSHIVTRPFPRKNTDDSHITINTASAIHSRRRRSLESFTLEDLSFTAPSNTVRVHVVTDTMQEKCVPSHVDKESYKVSQNFIEYHHTPDVPNKPRVENKIVNPQYSGVADRTELQQNLSVEAQKEISAIVAGLGIRERRNSFRQAISTSKDRMPVSNRSNLREFEPTLLSSNKSCNGSVGVNASQIVNTGGQNISGEHIQSKASSGLKSSPCYNSSSDHYQSSFRGSQKKLQQPRHGVELCRTKSDKHYTKDGSISFSASVRLKGTQAQVVDFSKETELVSYKSNIGGQIHSDFTHENRNLISVPKSRPSMWPVSLNVRTDVAGLGTFGVLQQTSEITRDHKGDSRKSVLTSRPKKSVDFPIEGKTVIPGAVPVQWPNATIKELDDKVVSIRKSEFSSGVRINSMEIAMDQNKTSRSGNIGRREEVSIIHQAKSIPNSSRSSQMCASSSEKRITTSEVTTSTCSAYKTSGATQLKSPSELVLEEARKRQDQHDREGLPIVQRREDGGLYRAAVASSKMQNSNETDVISYGLVAGVQLRQGSRDDLALCGSGPTVPPRVRRHASVVLLRHSLIETSDGTPVAPLSVWNSTQQGEISSTKSPANHQPPVWSGASGVDLDTIAANIKSQAGEQSTSVMRTLEALHLRKSFPRSAPAVSPAQTSFQHLQSPALKKQHYL